VLGVPYPLLFAFGIGLASLIPFLAGLVILVTTILLGFYDVALSVKFAIASFVIDQLTENLFAPRLIGDLIGLNPVWIIISLFIGAKLGGILGLFLAVPLASAIKQIVDDLRSPVLPEIEAADS
jgi:predicted PurR-regulated permease PerM